MKKDVHNMEKRFLQLLRNSREEPPRNNWQIIERELDRLDADRHHSKYKLLHNTLRYILLTGSCLLLNFVLQDVFENRKIADVDCISASPGKGSSIGDKKD